MSDLSLATQTMFAELAQRCLDAEFDELYDERGNFIRRRRKGYLYWYYVRDQGGSKKEQYVGPVRDAEINDRVKQFDRIKTDFKQRREIVRALLAAGLPRPDPMSGEVVEALWKAGFFRLRGVLVGTLAYQCYGGILAHKFPGASLQTGDADLAQFYDISDLVGDSMPPILDVLHGADASFRAVPSLHKDRVSRFRTDQSYFVEFLTPNRGSQRHQGQPSSMPALGGAAAQPMRYLDYLIRDPIRSVVLHKGGIAVLVPQPERYAVHKLIVAVDRGSDPVKSLKDVEQAQNLIRACLRHRSFELYEAWVEACERGPTWRKNLKRGRDLIDETLRDDFIFSLETHGWDEKKMALRQPKKRTAQVSSKPAKRKSKPKR